mgnify:CR=1 FL=1
MNQDLGLDTTLGKESPEIVSADEISVEEEQVSDESIDAIDDDEGSTYLLPTSSITRIVRDTSSGLTRVYFIDGETIQTGAPIERLHTQLFDAGVMVIQWE